ERRKSLRLNVHDFGNIKVSFRKSTSSSRDKAQQFIKDCLDISSGGFSFFVSKLESKLFLINDKIALVEIRNGNWSTKADAQITMIREIEPDEYNGLSYKVWRVSCKFTNIDQ